MCGIMGCVGQEAAAGILLEGLEKLTYRGYDSAGLAVIGQNGRISVCKQSGKLDKLLCLAKTVDLEGYAGIAHTRWATHGEPTQLNAHPHTDAAHKFAIVHNGIIENYANIKEELETEGVRFKSQTDTEVVAHLIAKLYTGDLLQTLLLLQKRVKGSYAFGILCSDEKDKVYCMRWGSPLIVAKTQRACYFASDTTALLPHAKSMTFLEDGEIAVLSSDGLAIYNKQGRKIEKQAELIKWSNGSTLKGNFSHYMLKEIMEQPEVLKKTIAAFDERNKSTYDIHCWDWLKRITKLTLVGCGTAFNASLFAKYAFEKIANVETSTETASEYRYAYLIPHENECILAVSQSGETADTLAAFRKMRTRKSHSLALCNVPGSTLAREAGEELTFYTQAGPEIAVASTKAYVAQVCALLLLAVKLGELKNGVGLSQNKRLMTSLRALPEKAERVLMLREIMHNAAEKYKNVKHIFLLGRGVDYAVCQEAALKLKEVSYIFSEAYPAGEMKHGPIALLEEGSLVIAIITQSETADKTISNLQEARARKATIMAVCSAALKERIYPHADETVAVDDSNEWTAPLLSIIPMQFFAYHLALLRGCDVDQPRNLAKSVTVE